MANTRNKVAIVFDGVVCPETPSRSVRMTGTVRTPCIPSYNFKPLPSFVKRVPPQRRVFFPWLSQNLYRTPLGSPFGRAVGGNAD
ncbi:MAG: hypothetical protein FWH14_08215 [Oscillospiraceae bacterium]|nr:hypothetical protein [Oscillospiraceae bacterium]